MKEKNIKIAINSGEPAGIGPDLCVYLAFKKFPAKISIFGDKETIKKRANLLKKKIFFKNTLSNNDGDGGIYVVDSNYRFPVKLKEPNIENSLNQLNKLKDVVSLLLKKEYDALVTLPISKKILSTKEQKFTGHTEYISKLSGNEGNEVMMLASKDLKVALVTTHVALKEVSRQITKKKLESVIETLNNDLKNLFKIKNPKIIITGLNPHAGEEGEFGHEEQKIIIPVIKKFLRLGLDIKGPIPADTAFTKKNIDMCDAFLAMYHDQGLAPFKAISFGRGINITLGLPFVRTSVDHGTAFDIVGTDKVDPSSFFEAIEMAIELS